MQRDETKLLLLRHGQSTWNAERRWQGHGDPPLSDAGRAEIRARAALLAGTEIDALVTSDLRRALETARIVGERLGVEPLVDARWRERHLGRWTGLRREEIRDGWPEEYARVRSGDPDATPPAGESLRQLTARVRAAAGEVAARHPGQRVLVATHRGVIRVLRGDPRPANGGIYPVRFARPAAQRPTSPNPSRA